MINVLMELILGNSVLKKLARGDCVEYFKLGDICEIKSGGTPSKRKEEYWKNGEIPWVKISDFKSKKIIRTDEFITQEGLENSSAKLIKKGSLLYTIFATIGKVAILDIEATTNQAIVGLEILNEAEINKKFLYYFLKSIEKLMKKNSRGVAQNNINLSILRDIKIPKIKIEVQKKIARNLEKIEETINKIKQQLENIEKLKKFRFVVDGREN